MSDLLLTIIVFYLKMVAHYLGFRQQFELLTEAPIHWPNNAGPTENKPECGFVGELCYSDCKLLIQDFS